MGANNSTGNSAPRIIPWQLIGGAWSVGGGAFSTAADGVLIASSPDSEASFNLAYDGVFEMRWNYSSFTGSATSIGTEVGFIPSASHVLSTPIGAVAGGYNVHDNQEGNSLRVAAGPSYSTLATLAKPSTSDVLMFRRDDSDTVTFLINDVVKYNFGTIAGSIAAAVRTNIPGTNVANFESREFAES